MKLNPKPPLVQNLMNVLITTDDDSNNMILSDSEITDLIRNLGSMPRVHLNEDLARKTILEHGRSTGAIMAMARDILLDESSGEEKIFRFESGH